MKFSIFNKGIAIASTFVLFDVIHKKIGGHASGGRYSEPHSWHEMSVFLPRFMIEFIIVYVVVSIYDSLAKKK